MVGQNSLRSDKQFLTCQFLVCGRRRLTQVSRPMLPRRRSQLDLRWHYVSSVEANMLVRLIVSHEANSDAYLDQLWYS